MKKILPATAALGALAVLAIFPVAAQTDTQASVPLKQCVHSSNLQTEILDQSTILATGTGRGGVVLDVKGCRLHPSDVLVFEYRGSNQICGPMDVQISVRDTASGMTTPCFIQTVKPVTRDEAKALSTQKKERKSNNG